jgi:thiamine monophosphate kinase
MEFTPAQINQLAVATDQELRMAQMRLAEVKRQLSVAPTAAIATSLREKAVGLVDAAYGAQLKNAFVQGISGNQDAISAYDDWVNVQKRPMPPIQSGIDAVNATSMLDISDGLAKDAARIAKASGVKLTINKQALDGYCARLDDVADRLDLKSIDWVLFGGEDHSLLATFPEGAAIPRSFKAIGQVEAGSGVYLDEAELPARGWDSALSTNK